MSKNKADQKTPKPKARLHLEMKQFTFFGKDQELMIDEMFTILDSGHTLTLFMTQSTCLSSDLWTLNNIFQHDYEIHYRFKKDEYDNPQVVVILQMEEEA